MNAGRSRPARREAQPDAGQAQLAHDLRSSLNGIRTWSQVLRDRLSGVPDPVVQRALDGIVSGVEQQARAIQSLLERDPR